MENDLFDIVITANSPGELYSLVRPLIKSISKHIPFSRIILVITPCQYASGREIEVAKTFPEIFEIILPEEYKKWIFKNQPPKGISFSKKGAVLYLGGDLINGVLLSKKLNYPAFAYSMNKIAWAKHYKTFFVPDKNIAQKASKKAPKEKIKVVGDLMVDSALLNISKEQEDNIDITFMPGSRPKHIKFLAPYFIKTANILKQKNSSLKFAFALSPYCPYALLEEFISKNKMEELEKKFGNSGIITIKDDKKFIISESGTEILLIEKNPFQAMQSAKLVVTIPGTNTAEAAALGKPMLVVIPTFKAEAFIFDGLVGIIGNAPFFGKYIKRLAIEILSRTEKYISLPNRKAGKSIIPELKGYIYPEKVAEKALELLNDENLMEQMTFELKKTMGPAGASEKIVEEIAGIT